MALINCPECGRQISDLAVSCPHCGYPISNTKPVSKTSLEGSSSLSESTNTLTQQNIEDARKNKRILLGIGGFILFIVLIFGIANSSDNSQKKTNSQAKTTVAETAPQTTATPKKTYTEKEKEEFLAVGRGLKQLKSSLKNPRSFILEGVKIDDDAEIVGYKFYATNGFGAELLGYMLYFTETDSLSDQTADYMYESVLDKTIDMNEYNEFVESL